MFNEIFNVMKCFPKSYITQYGDLILSVKGNVYLGTEFTQEDMYWIYDKLGNAVNHELTLKFIASGYDLNLVYPKKGESHGE